jgi:hypothetical protein
MSNYGYSNIRTLVKNSEKSTNLDFHTQKRRILLKLLHVIRLSCSGVKLSKKATTSYFI